MKPKMIYHYNMTDMIEGDMVGLAQQCASTMHLNTSAKKLLIYYATCSTGFRPSRSEIIKMTGIANGSIDNAKKELVREGIIADTKKAICIDWNRICIFASLDKTMTKGKHTVARCIPPKYILEEYKENDLYFPCKSQEEWIAFFNNMSQAEYESWLRAKKSYDKKESFIKEEIADDEVDMSYLQPATEMTEEELNEKYGYMYANGVYSKKDLPF